MEEKKVGTEDLHDSTQLPKPPQEEIGGGGTGDFTDRSSAEKRASQCSSNEHILFSPLLSGANVATHSVPESEIHGDDISCVRRSGGTNVATGENGDRDRKDESHCLTSDDSFPVDEKVVTCTCFDKAGCNHCGVPNFTEELSLVEVKVCDTCGDVGDESLLVSCNKCTDGAEHTYCMRVKLFEKPKSWTCQDCAPRAGTNKLVEDDVEVGARRKTGCLTKGSINLESSKGAKFSSGSSYPMKSSTIGVSSTTHLSGKRHGAPLEAPTAQKVRPIETRAVSSRSSKPCKNSMLSGDKKHISTVAQSDEKRRARKPPSNKLGKAKLGAAGSLLKSNSSKAANLKPKGQNAKAGCLQKQKVERNPAFHDDRKGKGPIAVSKSMTSECAFLEESNATGSKVVLADAYELNNPSMSLLASDSTVTTEKSEKETISGGETLADALELNNPPMPLLASDSAVTAAKNEEETISGGETLAVAYELNNPPMSLLASDSSVTEEKNEKETILGGETLADAYELNNPPMSSLASDSDVTAEKNETISGGETLADAYELNNPPMSSLASDSDVTAEKNETISGGETLADAYELNNPLMSSLASDSEVTAEKNETISGGETLADAYELNNPLMSSLASDSDVTAEKNETISGGETLADAYELNNSPMSLLASKSDVTAEKNEKEIISGGETLADAYELNNPPMSSLASDSAVTAEKNEKEIISGGETLADAYELNNPPMSFLASYSAVSAEKNEKETISGGETLFSGSRFCNLDVVGSSRQLDHRSRLSIHNTHKDSNCTNIKKKNVSQQAEHPTTVVAAMSMVKLCTGLASDERSHLRDLAQDEAATVLQDLVVPISHPSWLGKFLIHNSEGIARNCDGLQAHLSSCASREVLGRLPEIIILEELPCLRIWPSQFIRSQVTEENIALYFFAKDVDSYETYYRGLINCMINNDLALKGNLDGVELLIFPSNILPKRSQLWNQMMFLWGVFNAQVGNNSANTPVSNSVKQGNGDTVKRREFDLNAYPEDEDDDAGLCSKEMEIL